MNSVRVGVVGVGSMGANHCRNFANLPETDLVGVCDLSVEQGRDMAQRYQTTYFRDFAEMLAQVEAISIAASTPAHFKLSMMALEAGRHVFVEKPMTATLGEAQQLVNAARRHNRIVQVGHIERFNPTIEELHAVIADMSPVALTMRRLSPFVQSNKDVDVIFDLMIHDIDLVLDLVRQPICAISAQGSSVFTEAIDHAVAMLTFEGGPIATLMASRVTEQKVRALEITTKSAYIEADLLNKGISVHRRTIPEFRSNRYRQESLIERIFVPTVEPLMLELKHFAYCIRNNTAPLVPVEDGLRAVEVATQIANLIQGVREPVMGFSVPVVPQPLMQPVANGV